MALGTALSQPSMAMDASLLARGWKGEARLSSSCTSEVPAKATRTLTRAHFRTRNAKTALRQNFTSLHLLSKPPPPSLHHTRWFPSTHTCKASPTSTPSSSSSSATISPSPAPSSNPPQEMMDELADFLRKDLPHLFDEQGIDRSRYDDKVEFLDPITRYDSISGYLFNIQMLRYLFGPIFELHDVKQTAPDTLTTRWTMMMTFKLLPWQPVVTFTGESIMQVNPTNGKFKSHVDIWDSVEDNNYFSLEALKDLVSQMLRTFKTPDRETPKYQLLKRTAEFEVRRYEPYVVVEGPLTEGEGVTGGRGFGTVAGYIQGKNAKAETIQMTTPVFTQAPREGSAGVFAQVVLPSQSGRESWPEPSAEGVRVTPVSTTFAAAIPFGGTPTEERVREMEASLRSALRHAGLKPKPGYALARYNDPRTFELQKRNDIIIELEEYEFP